jgi:hypothetical protein
MPSKIKAYRFQLVFSDKKGGKYRKTNVSQYRKKAGAYLIREKGSKEILYVGSSKTDIYKAGMRHFYPYNDARQWLGELFLFNDRYQRRVYFDPDKRTYEIRFVVSHPKNAEILEAALIQKYNPAENEIREKALAELDKAQELREEYEQADKRKVFTLDDSDFQDEVPF